MAETKNDGGPAFPQKADDKTSTFMGIPKGMFLRDYFAAKAMQALIPKASKVEYAANLANEWADAMLKAREK